AKAIICSLILFPNCFSPSITSGMWDRNNREQALDYFYLTRVRDNLKKDLREGLRSKPSLKS
ncbi:MAG: hypothetical protein ACK58Z_03770, partial [Pseudanabaena sp.]